MRTEGLLSFPLTPFTADDTVNLEVLAEHVAQQVDSGPAALFVACGTGEFTALSLAEYKDVVSTAVRVSGGRKLVFAGVGGGPQIARDFAAAAAECGADGMLLLPPYLVACTPAGLVGHVRYVAKTASLPMIVYQRANAVLGAGQVLFFKLPPHTGGVPHW
jgi:5-dehydro-4-deoxyglucarate dehydratase